MGKWSTVVTWTVGHVKVELCSISAVTEKLLCQRFYTPMGLRSRSNVSNCNFLPLHIRKPLFTDASIVPRWRGVHFLVHIFCSPPTLSCMKQVPFENTGIGLQYMQKLSVYCRFRTSCTASSNNRRA